MLGILKDVSAGLPITKGRVELEVSCPFQVQSTNLRPFNQIQIATEKKKELCVDKGWNVWEKNGEKVKLRHVLAKISVWVTEIIKIVDIGVSFDHSGHAALPWAVVKFIITVENQTTNPVNARFSVFHKAEFKTFANDAVCRPGSPTLTYSVM